MTEDTAIPTIPTCEIGEKHEDTTIGLEDTCSTSVCSFSSSSSSGRIETGDTIETETEILPSGDNVRAVSFSTIEIREYPRCLGDHPAVTGGGPPLSIEWEPTRVFVLPLDEYEAYLAESEDGGSTKRTPAMFQLPSAMRWEIAREDCESSPQQIQECLRQVQKSKMRRQHTFAMQEYEHIQIVLESCCRKFRRWRNRINKTTTGESV